MPEDFSTILKKKRLSMVISRMHHQNSLTGGFIPITKIQIILSIQYLANRINK